VCLCVVTFSRQSFFLAGFSAAVFAGVVHLGTDQQQGECPTAERSADIRSGAVSLTAGTVPLRLLQTTQVRVWLCPQLFI
jgi:hypothetical protein